MSGDKQNENKFMAMLERRGIVRKVEPDEADTAPGMPQSEDLSSDKPQYNRDIRTLVDLAYAPPNKVEEPVPVPDFVPTAVEPTPIIQVREEQPVMATERTVHEPQNVTYDSGASKQVNLNNDEFSAPASARENLFNWINNEAPANETANEAAIAEPAVATTENYTDRYLNIDELYDALALRSKKTDTIYLIEDYLKTIPDSLPDESRRQIVKKIVTASGFDFDLLMGDGILRVKMLKEYAEKFARYTEDYIRARQSEVFELENQIVEIHNLIDNRRELHKKQFMSIEAEAARLREILAFINS
jgi:hypothetical protein